MAAGPLTCWLHEEGGGAIALELEDPTKFLRKNLKACQHIVCMLYAHFAWPVSLRTGLHAHT